MSSERKVAVGASQGVGAALVEAYRQGKSIVDLPDAKRPLARCYHYHIRDPIGTGVEVSC